MTSGWEAIHNRGYRHQLRGELVQAQACYEQALALKPDSPFPQLGLAQLHMFRSAFREGRELYEARFAARPHSDWPDWRQLPIPRWRGEDFAGKRIYLWGEEGLGELILFMGFLPHLLAQSPAHVTLGAYPKILTLCARSFPQASVEPVHEGALHALSATLLELYPKMEAVGATAAQLAPMKRDYERARDRGLFDYAAPMGDLLVHFMPGYVPARQQGAYLTADPARMAQMRAWLDGFGRNRRIGISWHTPNPKDGAVRSIPLPQWQPVMDTPGASFFSLQHGMPPEDAARCAALGVHLPPFEPAQDIEALAALIAAMDEVVTIDNSNVHLAGALGIPTTVLLPKGCNFTWPLLEEDATLWYRSVRTARQETGGDWAPVLDRVAAALRDRV